MYAAMVLRVPSDGRSAQDIALVTAGTPNLVSVSDLSAELNSRYALAHGYAFYQYHDSMVPRHIVTWNKVRVLLDMINRTTHEWILWLDTDAVVTNRSISLGDIISSAEWLRDLARKVQDAASWKSLACSVLC